jgi:urease accessory protein
MTDNTALLRLLQLSSPVLPVGAYSYSEGLEFAIESGWIADAEALQTWIEDAMRDGSTAIEAAILARVMRCLQSGDLAAARRWDQWLAAARETAELRAQSLEMGQSLRRLLMQLHPDVALFTNLHGWPGNFAVVFGVAAAHWEISARTAVLAYLQSWATNMIAAGVKLIPLGQSAGQRLLLALDGPLQNAADAALTRADDDLAGAAWGLQLASIAHETQYTRLFRS